MLIQFLFGGVYGFYRYAAIKVHHIDAEEIGPFWQRLRSTVFFCPRQEIFCVPEMGGNESQKLLENDLKKTRSLFRGSPEPETTGRKGTAGL